MVLKNDEVVSQLYTRNNFINIIKIWKEINVFKEIYLENYKEDNNRNNDI